MNPEHLKFINENEELIRELCLKYDIDLDRFKADSLYRELASGGFNNLMEELNDGY